MPAVNRDKWLAWRRQGIGASDVAGVVGLSPWSSPWSIWADKAGLMPDDDESEAMTAGRWLEAAIGPWFTHETGLHVAGGQAQCVSPRSSHHRCTVDWFVFDSGQPLSDEVDRLVATMASGGMIPSKAVGLSEIKVTGPGRRWDEIPAYYQTQGQWQMHVTGLDKVWFAVLMGRRLDIHELARDQADIDYLVGEVDRFWHEHVVTGVPPEVDGSEATAKALAAMLPGDRKRSGVDADESQARTVELWKETKARIKELQGEERLYANRIKAGLGVDTDLWVDGELAVSWRRQATRRVDLKAFRARLPRTARRFTVETETRVLRAHTPKETP